MKKQNYFITLWNEPYSNLNIFEKFLSIGTLPIAIFILPFRTENKEKLYKDASLINNQIMSDYQKIKNNIGGIFEKRK